MSMRADHYVKLAKALPPRLSKFFARYPPPAILPRPAGEPLPTLPPTATPKEKDAILPYPNPFKCHKNPATGKWHDPVFSLRRQADLVKLARNHGVEELLPHTVKGTEERLRRRVENGLRVKGTGVGQKVKGKASERTMKGRYVLPHLGFI